MDLNEHFNIKFRRLPGKVFDKSKSFGDHETTTAGFLTAYPMASNRIMRYAIFMQCLHYRQQVGFPLRMCALISICCSKR